MVNSTSESTSSALESAAMDLASTGKSNTEPLENTNSTTANGTSGQPDGNINPPDTVVSTNPVTESTNPTQSQQTTTSQATATSSSDSSVSTQSHVSAIYGNYDDYQILPDAPWPPPVFVRQQISPQERYYIEHRWYSQWSFFDSKATQNKNRYYRTQLIVGIGSVTVPVLVGINATEPISATILYFTTVIISLAVAMATAIESLYTFGDNWRSYRSAAEDLRQEKSLYDVKAGRYNTPNSFLRFVERCEEIIAQQNGRWIQSQEKAAEQIKDDADSILDQYDNKTKTDSFGNTVTTATVAPITSDSTYSEYTPPATTNTETYVDPNAPDQSAPTSYG